MNGWEFFQLNIHYYQRILQSAEAALGKDKLDVKSFFILSSVEEIPHPAALAKHLMMPKPTITFLIKKLEKLGYLRRKTVAGDLRKFEMVITAAGRKAQERGRVTVSGAIENSLSKLTTRERENYLEYILKLQNP